MDLKIGDKAISRFHGKGKIVGSPNTQSGATLGFETEEGEIFSYFPDGHYFDEKSSFRSPFPDLWRNDG